MFSKALFKPIICKFKKGGFMKATTKKMLGARIKDLRKAGGLSQEQLAEKINIDSKHLSRIEVGNSYPSIDTVENIAKALNVEIKDLFEFPHEENTAELKRSIIKILGTVDESKLRLILKVLKAIAR